MPLPRTEVVPGSIAELASFESLIRSIDDAGWSTASRCEGWSVGDVCAHVSGTIAALAEGRFEDVVGPEATARQVAQRRGRSAEALADELHAAAKVFADLVGAFDDTAWAGPPPLDIPGSLGQGVEAIWYDAYMHGTDVRAALGQPADRGAGLRAAVSHVADILTQRGWGPATIAVDGMGVFPVGDGGGARITGDPLTFVFVATGRADPAQLGLDATVNIYAG